MGKGRKIIAAVSSFAFLLSTPAFTLDVYGKTKALDEEAVLQVGNGVSLVEHGKLTGNKVDGASYDSETNTLTLNNCKMGYDNNQKAFINAEGMGEDFTIRLVGENEINQGFVLADDLTLQGPGTLTLSEGSNYGGILSYRNSLTIDGCTLNITGVPDTDMMFYGISGFADYSGKTTEAVIKNADINISSTTPAGKELYNVGIDAQTGNITIIDSDIDIDMTNGRTYGMVAGLENNQGGTAGGTISVSGSTVKVLIDSDITDSRYQPYGMYFYNMPDAKKNYYYVGEGDPNQLKSFEDAFDFWDWNGRYNVYSSIIITDSPLPEYCTHKWDEGKVTTAPSCENEGVKTYTCTLCKDTKTEKIAPLGHDWGEWKVIKEASCLEEGAQMRTCSRCRETENKVVAALGHDYIEKVIKEATCTEDGIKSKICSRCGNSQETVVIPATGHNYEWIVTKEPTFHEDGVKTGTCQNCGDTKNERIPKLSESHTHDFTGKEEIVKNATCTEEGSKKIYCTEPECGAFIVETIPVTEHTSGEWTTVKDATCSETGSEQRICTVCGTVLETRATDKLPHTYGEWTVTLEPTCTEAGIETAECTVCGETAVRGIDPVGHDYAEWTVSKEATCTEDGSEMAVCTRCGEKSTRTVEAKGHSFGEWKVVKEATENEDGERQVICSVCGEVKSEIIPKLSDIQPPVLNDDDSEDKDTTNNAGSVGKNNQVPATGDETPILLFVTGLFGLAGVVVATGKKRKLR